MVGQQRPAPNLFRSRSSVETEMRPRNGARLLQRMLPAGIAASVVLGLFALNWPVKKAAATTPVTAEQIVDPLISVSDLNLQRMKDQQAMIETLQLELRALRLEIVKMNEPEKLKQLSDKLDMLQIQTNSLWKNN